MQKNSDIPKLKVLLAEIASDSLRKKESKEEYKERLEALRDEIEVSIDAALY